MSRGKGVLVVVFSMAIAATAAYAVWMVCRQPCQRPVNLKVVELMKTIAAAQERFREANAEDPDNDRLYVYASLSEFAREARFGFPVDALKPLSSPCGSAQGNRQPGKPRGSELRVAEDTGYLFQIWLEDEYGWLAEIAERNTSAAPHGATREPQSIPPVAQDQAKEHYVLYAWPVEYGKTGFATYVINEQRVCYRTVDQSPSAKRYTGTTLMPKSDAAFEKGEPVFTGKLAKGEGTDGNVWEAVE